LPQYKTLYFGTLPFEAINKAIDLELDTADIILNRAAQIHAKRRHAEDYDECLPHLAAVIANPLYVRDDFRNDGKIEIAGQPAVLNHWLLIAISIMINTDGYYEIASFYPISQKKVDQRRHSGHLKRVIP
jgi:hypothetical protein